MRTKGAALATACDWFFNYVVVQTTPLGIHYLKWGLYLVYAVLNACFVPLIYLFIVETAGKSLEQIDRWFAANPGWFVHRADREGYAAVEDGDEEGLAVSKGMNGVEAAPEERQGLWKVEDDDYDEDAASVA